MMPTKEIKLGRFEIGYVILLLAILFAGLLWMNRGSGRVAVVDSARVAAELGWRQTMEEETAAMRQRAQDQAQTMRRAWENEMQALRRSYEDASDEDERRLLRAEMERTQARHEAQLAEMRTELQRQRHGLAVDFRSNIAPAVRSVARSARADVILEAGPILLYRRDALDLTEAVIKEARNQGLATPTGVLELPDF